MNAKAEIITREDAGHVVADPFLEMIERVAANPTAGVEMLERMLAMKERVEKRQAEQAFNAAMSAVQAAVSRIAADSNNPQTKSKYASYAALDRTLRPLYTAHGFAVSFDSGDGAPEGQVRVLCYLSHRDGHTRTYHADIAADGKGAKGGDVMTKTHAIGSAFTYGQRYLLKLMFNVAIGEDDDDGNAAGGGELLSEEQIKMVRAAIVEVDANEALFLTWLRKAVRTDAETLADFPASAYAVAIDALSKKRAAK